jgi:hypothetical protein
MVVSKGSLGLGSGRGGEYLRLPFDVKGAARALSEHFDHDDFYWAMVYAYRRK